MEQLHQNDVKQRLIDVCRDLMTVVSGSYGPMGRGQLVQANAQCADALTVTSVAERYFAKLNVKDCPIANAYGHILKSKVRNHSDSGLLLAGLSASLQLEIQAGSLAQIPHSAISKGLQLALDWSLQYLENPKCPVRVAVKWSSLISISAVIRGIVSSKSTTGIDEETMDAVVIPLIIQAFVSVFGFGNKQFSLISHGLRLGRSHRTKRNPPLCNARVALFNVTIEPVIESTSSTSITHVCSYITHVGDQLEQLGTTAVLSQKIIPNYLQTYLAAKGIFTLGRLSAARILGVQMLSGATILSDGRIDDSVVRSSLGYQKINKLSHVITMSLKMLASLIANPHVVAGAGCCEIHLAAALRQRASQLIPAPVPIAAASSSVLIDAQTARTLRQLRQVITAFAACLENMAGRLGQSHVLRFDRAATTDQVCAANQESLAATRALAREHTHTMSRHDTIELFGWDSIRRSVIKVLQYEVRAENHGHDQEKDIAKARIIDILQPKKDALVLALESVSSLARMASVVRST